MGIFAEEKTTAEKSETLQQQVNKFQAGVMTQICLCILTEAATQESRRTHLQTAPGPLPQNVLDFTSRQARVRESCSGEMVEADKESKLGYRASLHIISPLTLRCVQSL